MTAPPDPGRGAQITALRARLAGMGGLGTAARPRSISRPAIRPGQPGVGVEPGDSLLRCGDQLGFSAEATEAGIAFVRRVSVDLTPFLDRIGFASVSRDRILHRLDGREGSSRAVEAGDDGIGVLDIETLGLHGSGVLAFLVGVGVARGTRLAVQQYLLASPEGEPALLAAVASWIAAHPVIVTYNGRCFDVPVLTARCIVNRLEPGGMEPSLHCDLLGPVRRLFRDRLGACTLRRAEVDLLGFERHGDVPGSEAPWRYRTWLHGGSATLLGGVIRHNEIDLCTTAVLAARLAAHVDGDLVLPEHPADRFRLGMYLERSTASATLGHSTADVVDEHLRHALDSAVEPWSRRAGHRLARRLSRGAMRDRLAAQSIWDRLWRTRITDTAAARALAISLERGGELEAALDVCRRLAHTLFELGESERMYTRWACSQWTAEWQKRRSRLERRCGQPAGTALEWAAWMSPHRHSAMD